MYGIYSRVLTLTYDEQGGSEVTDSTGTQYMNSVGGYSNITITLPTSTRTYYSLTGWSINGTTYAANTNITISDSTTATAVWASLCPALGTVWNYDYTGGEQTFTIPCAGTYKLEAWGAKGGGAGGNGGYTYEQLSIEVNKTIYIYVGGNGVAGSTSSNAAGGYNGGGVGRQGVSGYSGGGGGGGATHFAYASGLLSSLSSNISAILIVAGGGGGNGGCGYTPGEAGNGSGGGSFGQGLIGEVNSTEGTAGGGGGFYGGRGALSNIWQTGNDAYGGTGYLSNTTAGGIIKGNTLVPTHDGTGTMTGNSGNGYAKITLVSLS